jgi:hypothetical protein
MLHTGTGSQKFKMAATKPEVPVSQLLCKVTKKFQRLTACFQGRETQWRFEKAPYRNWKSEIQYEGAKPHVPISQLLCKIARKFQLLAECFYAVLYRC